MVGKFLSLAGLAIAVLLPLGSAPESRSLAISPPGALKSQARFALPVEPPGATYRVICEMPDD